MTPIINIKYNKFLDPIFIQYIKSQTKYENWNEPPVEEVKRKVDEYKSYWSEIENIVLKEMQEISGINFKRNIIDVHIVSGNPRPFSFPIILKSGYTKDEFISVLMEEILHVLMGEDREKFLKMFNDIKNKYDENDLVINHILIFGIMRKIYSKLGKDWSPSFNSPEYSKAYELSI